jgi:alpha-L-rhamnosidase
MSELLGYDGKVKKTQEKMDAFKKAFNAQLWRNGEYRSEKYTGETDDRTQALAVVAELAEEAKFPGILQKLKTQKFASPYLEKYVLEALFIMGYEEYGLQRMKERYSEMINDPARTTLYELWNIGGGSINHAWSGGGLTILSQYVCGVYPIEAAWKTIRIRPQMGNLTYAATENTTVNGRFSVKINKFNEKYSVHTLLPKENNVIVMIPVSYKKNKPE